MTMRYVKGAQDGAIGLGCKHDESCGHIDGSAVGPTFSFHRIQTAFQQEGYHVCYCPLFSEVVGMRKNL
jgi:hypothetical protein